MGLMIFRVPSKKGALVGSQLPERHQDLGSKPRRLFFFGPMLGKGGKVKIFPPPKKKHATKSWDNFWR